jgi:hypothetical protein
MNRKVKKVFRNENTARNAWIAFAGLLAVGLIAMTVRELPSMRRELRLLRM